MKTAICVENLQKKFSIIKNKKGIFANINQYLRPKYEELHAVNDINFRVDCGEKIAFIGPNGAGKSTTIKLLTGILQPTSGHIKILGLDPFLERKKVAYKIGAVFGQRSQLWYHLSAYHSFKLLATIYDLPKKTFHDRLNHLIEIFQLHQIISRPVKELSLGERMRCELVSSLLHQPEILFLDEFTIGLDLMSKDRIREFVYKRAKDEGTTIFLTSHDVADIEKICDRIIVINHGKIIVDQSVSNIKKLFLNQKLITIKVAEDLSIKSHHALKHTQKAKNIHQFEVDINKMSSHQAIHFLAENYHFYDISIEDPPLEEIIKGIYQS